MARKKTNEPFGELSIQGQIQYLKDAYEIMKIKLNFIIAVTSFIAITMATAVFKYLFSGG